ncbi:hypothetical protein ACROSR_02655 [Roseovarius tibetensis]|uniref:hypothetical protein n=1 Tax=Roseovarius tibetensis TaxID=2685897 RepID=UPI003D7F6D1B
MLRVNEPSGLSHADSLLFGAAYATLLFTILYYVTGLHDAFSAGFAIEDGPVEWATAMCLLLSSLVLAHNAVSLWSRRGARAGVITAIYALAFFFAAGEEISWGFRLFNWEAGEFFREHNTQQETNLHNLVLGDVKLVKTVFGSGLTVVIMLYLIVLPLVYRHVAPIGRIADWLVVPVADTRHVLLTVAASLVMLSVDMRFKWEPYEFIFSLLTLSIFLRPRNATSVT